MDILRSVFFYDTYEKILASVLAFHQQATEVITSQTRVRGYYRSQAFRHKSRLINY